MLRQPSLRSGSANPPAPDHPPCLVRTVPGIVELSSPSSGEPPPRSGPGYRPVLTSALTRSGEQGQACGEWQ
jgi:hypothetical protein